MTTGPLVSAGSIAVLPSGRAVAVGDTLAVDEARDLVILQSGLNPLRPMAVSAVAYAVMHSGAVTGKDVFREFFTLAPALIINESQARTLAEAWLDSDDVGAEVPVPIGNGLFVPKGYAALELHTQGPRFHEWYTQLMVSAIEADFNTFEAEAVANTQPRGLA